MTTSRKRSRSRGTARAQTVVQAADAQPGTSEETGTVAVGQADWRQEYSYVMADLRTLLIVSAVLFGAIIVLGFVL